MKVFRLPLLVLLLLLPVSSPWKSSMEELSGKTAIRRAPASVQEEAAKGVLERLLPAHLSSFRFEIDSKGICGESICFRISNINNSSSDAAEILIEGTTAVELSAGLHWYLKYWTGAHISWDKTGGVQLASVPSPGPLPHVDDQGVKIILLFGEIGKDGRRRLTGCLSKELTYLWHLQDKRPSGKRFFRVLTLAVKICMTFLVDQPSLLGLEWGTYMVGRTTFTKLAGSAIEVTKTYTVSYDRAGNDSCFAIILGKCSSCV